MKFSQIPSGTSANGKQILAYKTITQGPQYLYLMAGVHGDEIEGMYVLEKLFEQLEKNKEFKEIPIILIPVLNPDGKENNTRVNANGVDLNRNLPSRNWQSEYLEKKYYPGAAPGSEPENQFLVTLFNQYPPHLIISFHSWKPMLNFNGDCEKLAQFISQYNQYPVVGEIEDYPTPGSLGEYGPEYFKSPVLTFECPLLNENLNLESIWLENKEGLMSIFNQNILDF